LITLLGAKNPQKKTKKLQKQTKKENKNIILTRNIGETIKIGDDIDMTILGVRGN